MQYGPVFISLHVKGHGKLKIVALHDRYSRRGHGVFLPGGERYVASNREEIFHYFDPGDLKPPLCVYFSGYKTMQGFEGYFMMKRLGCPFLLIAEPRLSGGCFYMGTEEYEKACADIIRRRMEELGFSNDQVILSGLSMGTFGALYYGCDILPHAMILGKPLASIGLVAENERLHRPGGFPTSLDVLNYIAGDTDDASVQRLDDKFWNKFDATDWRSSKFIVAYMIEDDYDSKAYDMLISHLKTDGAQLYGKGIHGRHNDATGDIVAWFIGQYERVLIEDFSRRIEK
jgi:accessory secretory protein Asp2